MKRRWRLVESSILLFSVALASGCTDTGSSGSASQTDKKPKIALVMKSLANEFFKTMADGASDYQSSRADSFDLILNGIKDERDLARQVGLVEGMIAVERSVRPFVK